MKLPSSALLSLPSVGIALFISSPALAEVDFEKQVWPILESKCVECHRAPYEENGRTKDPKAELRLDAAWAITLGSENGEVLKPGDAKGSYLYEVTVLPEDDDMFMPPKGDPMTKKEIRILKAWIDEGAHFGDWEGNLEGKPAEMPAEKKEEVARVREHETFYTELGKGVEPAPEEAVKAAEAAGAQVFLLQTGSPLLRVDFLTGVTECTDDDIAALQALAPQVAQLDLGRTSITDGAAANLAKLPNLVQLDLRQTAVSDKTLASLKNLAHLRVLNLYGTQVTDAGLKHLAAMKGLKSVYLWGSKVTPKAAQQFASAHPGLSVSFK